MPTLSNPDLTLLRSKNQKAKIYASYLIPTVLWSASINDASITKGTTEITFNGGFGLDFSAIEPLQELLVGISFGGSEIGRLRIRDITSGDGGLSGVVTVAANELDLIDNGFLSFTHNYPLKVKWPLITGTPENAEFLKDTNIPYTDQNDLTNPVVIAGENRAGFINSTLGYMEIESQLPDSYVTKSGATIVTYAVSVYPTTGVTISLDSGTGVGYIRFATPGIYWGRWSVTDSNDKTQLSYRWYRVHSTDIHSPHYPITAFNLSQISGDWGRGGWETSVSMHDKATVAEIPDKTGAIIWQVASYNGTTKNITFLPDESNTLINGYVRKERIETDISTDLKDADFQIQTLDALLSNHFQFSISLAARENPTQWYEYTSNLTVPQALHHLWLNHSTLFEIADVFLGNNTLGRAYAEMEDGNLYSMADDLSFTKGIRAHVVCDQGNRVHLTYDIQLLTDAERIVLPVVQSIEKMDRSEDMVLVREPYDRIALVKVSGFAWDKTFSNEGCPDPPCPNVEPLCASAPGDMPSDEGATIVNFDRQVFEDQDHANQLAGRYFAQVNNRYPELRINFPGNYAGVLAVHLEEFWTIDLVATDSVREIVWADQKLICRTVTIQVDTEGGIITTNASFEPEQLGNDGVPGYCLDEIPTPTEEIDALVVTWNDGGSCYVRNTENWILRNGTLTGDDILDRHGNKDPFWITKQGSDTDDAILIKTNIGKVFRTVNQGVAWSDVTPTDNPPNGDEDSPPPTPGNITYIQYEGDAVNIDTHFVLATRVVGSEWRSWIYRTEDDFATDAWVQIAEIIP